MSKRENTGEGSAAEVEDDWTQPIETAKVVGFPMTFDKYVDTYNSGLDKYIRAYVGATVRGQMKTREEWDAVLAKNL